MGRIPASHTVLKARRQSDGSTAPWAPVPIEEAVATIAREKPALVFAPHVETAAGMVLPDGYLKALSEAVHAVGGLMVLDCIASGALWVDMQATGVDILMAHRKRDGAVPPAAPW